MRDALGDGSWYNEAAGLPLSFLALGCGVSRDDHVSHLNRSGVGDINLQGDDSLCPRGQLINPSSNPHKARSDEFPLNPMLSSICRALGGGDPLEGGEDSPDGHSLACGG